MADRPPAALGFEGMLPATTGRPAYYPATLLKIYLYGYLNRIPSSRRPCGEIARPCEPLKMRETGIRLHQTAVAAAVFALRTAKDALAARGDPAAAPQANSL